jgi:Ca2+-binding RTX toxin-like protein
MAMKDRSVVGVRGVPGLVRVLIAVNVVVILAAASSGRAAAATTVNDPWGDEASEAWVNADPGDGNSHWISWKKISTGECAFTSLGDSSGFSDDFNVQGNGGNDKIRITTFNGTFCGFSMTTPNYNGHFMDLFGQDGNDYMTAGTGDTFLHGANGSDALYTQRGSAFVTGGSGEDAIWFAASGSASGTVQGDDDNDCIIVNGALSPAPSMSCGNGSSDLWSGPGTKPTDCEGFNGGCCSPFVC